MKRVVSRRGWAIAGAAAVLAVSAQPASAHIPQIPVKAQPNPIREYGPAVSADYFAWTHNSRLKRGHYNLFAQAMVSGSPTGPVTRVNISNSQGYTGGIAGTRLAYQQITNGRRQSDIRYFNLASHRRSNPPVGVNTKRWEYEPQITPGYLLFARYAHRASHIILWNLTNNSHTTLLTIPLNRHGTAFVETGQLNGDYATFYACRNRTHCSVYLYTISPATLTHIPHPTGLLDYYPAVSSTGTLYFARSGSYSCGKTVQLMQLPLGGTATSLNAFHPGTDLGPMQTFNDGTNDQVNYTRIACVSNGWDIYRVTVP